MMTNNLHLNRKAAAGLRTFLIAGLIALALALKPMAPARAANLIVNSINDVDDGTCNAAHCSLREAINAANATAGADTITFNLGGVGFITPSTHLPQLKSDHTTINGGGQVILDGGIGGMVYGLRIMSSYNHIHGLIIAHFDSYGILIDTGGGANYTAAYNVIGTNGDGINDANERNIFLSNDMTGIGIVRPQAHHNVVAGNYIGVQGDGLTADPNGSGVMILDEAHDNLIGTNNDNVSDDLERNIISGNDGNGVYIALDAEYNTVAGNYIGTDATGTQAVGNGGAGVKFYLEANHNTVGPENVISGNGFAGVEIYAASYNNVYGNNIGTDVTGTQPLGNANIGVRVTGAGDYGAKGNMIGAYGSYFTFVVPYGNKIAFNGDMGVTIDPAPGDGSANDNAILYNSIHSNGGIGINLSLKSSNCWDGVTPNDAGDPDDGGNDVINHPVLTSATGNASNTYGNAQIDNGLPNTEFIIQFFANPVCDPSGFGEGQIYLGETTITTNAAGDATTGTITLPPVPAGYFLTTTATMDGVFAPLSTSEFSPCMQITPAAMFMVSKIKINYLLTYLSNLVSESQLDAQVARPLQDTANAALAALEREDGRTATAHMQFFIAQVDEGVRRGSISQAIGQQLTSDANDILRLIQDGQ